MGKCSLISKVLFCFCLLFLCERMMDFPTRGAFARDSVILNKWVWECKCRGHCPEEDSGLIHRLEVWLSLCLPTSVFLRENCSLGTQLPFFLGCFPPGIVDQAVLKPSVTHEPWAFAPQVPCVDTP